MLSTSLGRGPRRSKNTDLTLSRYAGWEAGRLLRASRGKSNSTARETTAESCLGYFRIAADTQSQLDRMTKFVKDPTEMRELTITHDGAKQVASRLITDYAQHLKDTPHQSEVSEHMSLPDTAAALLRE